MEITEAHVIFEDNHLIAINKQAGAIVQGDKTEDTPLSEHVKDFIRKKYGKLGNVYCGVVHRIDRPVSGVVIFAKTSKALARMNQLIHDRQIRKHYWAIVRKAPDTTKDNLVHYLFKDERKNKTVVSKDPKDGYLKAEMNYEVVGSSDYYHLLDVELITGRHHQIRAQLSAIGSPIKGDLKYGFPRSNQDASICLHAKSMSFIHPVTLQTVVLKADPPRNKLWNCFADFTGIILDDAMTE